MTIRTLTAMALLLALFLAACGNDVETTKNAQATAEQAPAAAAPAAAVITGPVAETMNAANYTYVRVEHEGESVWAAGPQTEMAVGDEVTISTQMPMPGFKSEALDRTFDVLYFVSGFTAEITDGHGGMGGMGGMPAAEHPKPEPAADLDLSDVARLEGGRTVAEIHAEAADLAGQTVRFQGKVVKYNGGIMGRNWVHVRDGSGAEGTDDLTVTTDGFAQVGDLVVVEGTLATDRDFGAGYKYAVIVEQATVTKQ